MDLTHTRILLVDVKYVCMYVCMYNNMYVCTVQNFVFRDVFHLLLVALVGLKYLMPGAYITHYIHTYIHYDSPYIGMNALPEMSIPQMKAFGKYSSHIFNELLLSTPTYIHTYIPFIRYIIGKGRMIYTYFHHGQVRVAEAAVHLEISGIVSIVSMMGDLICSVCSA